VAGQHAADLLPLSSPPLGVSTLRAACPTTALGTEGGAPPGLDAVANFDGVLTAAHT